MDANDFLVKIKANGNSKDWDVLSTVHSEYKKVLSKLPTKDRGQFSLNVLSLLCRNLEKVPSWEDAIDQKTLLMLSIDCVRETRGLNKTDQIKTLACIYHVHRYVVKKNTPIPPELILKISFMPFEIEAKNLIGEHSKTYWNILADRLTYIGKLKGKSTHKLLPKLTEDLLKVIEIYDTVSFCSNVLVYLFKKLHSLFSDGNSEHLNALYGDIFKKISTKSDLNSFKNLTDKEIIEMYMKINDCLYVVAENASKSKFRDSSLSIGVRTTITLLGHRSDIFHCLQTFYLNSFCDLFGNKASYADAVFKSLTTSCDLTEKLGYKEAMMSTYPYLNQFLRLYIEYSITNGIKENFSIEIQTNYLNFMLKIISKLESCQQMLKCENCTIKSGLHDSLRLSLLTNNIITKSLEYNIDITSIITIYNKLITTQYNILNELKEIKCYNYKKFLLKLQTDTHNTAILLNKHSKYEFSIYLFEIYVRNELCSTETSRLKNLTRALFNKSICELDNKLYEDALIDAFLGMVFSQDLTSDKYMSIAMDVKAKSLKDDENVQNDEIQLMTLVDACRTVVEKGLYGDMKQYFKDVKFRLKELSGVQRDILQLKGLWRRIKLAAKKTVSEHRRAVRGTGGGQQPPSPSQKLLTIMDLCPMDFVEEENKFDSDAVSPFTVQIKPANNTTTEIKPKETTVIKPKQTGTHTKKLKKNKTQVNALLTHEFSMYVKLWPAMMPVAGCWKSLLNLLEGDQPEWMAGENEDTILWALLNAISRTLSVVRNINNDHYKNVVKNLLQWIDKVPEPIPVDIRVAQTLLLFLKAEYDIADASAKYGWKITETIIDPDKIQLNRTLEQEHIALQSAIQAVDLWNELVVEINTVTQESCLRSALTMADIFVNQFLYFGRLAHGLQMAHVCCIVAEHVGQKDTYIRNVGVLAYHIEQQTILHDHIELATMYWPDVVQAEGTVETAIIFICDVSIYHYKCGSIITAAKLVELAQLRTLKAYETYPDINLDLAVGRLMEAQILLSKNRGPSIMTAVNGLQRHYLSVANNCTVWSARRLRASTTKWVSSVAGASCTRVCRALALWRRARAACACAVLSHAAARAACAARHCVNTHNVQHAQVTIDNRLKYILGLSTEQPPSITEPKVELFAPKQDLEVMLESQQLKSISPTRRYVQIPGYQTPDFLKHENCDCYACDNIDCTIISFIIGGLEASTYFRANEIEIARNYYRGVMSAFNLFNKKIKFVLNKYNEMEFEKYIIDHVRKVYDNEFNTIKLEILIDASYFELKCKNFSEADDYLVTIHEVLDNFKNPDEYMKNEVMNLMIASARVRNVNKKQENNLETEFENLKLSPKEIPKTPISKAKIPVMPTEKITVKDEEIPKKRKVIKLNLDEGSPDEKDKEKPKSRKAVFKIPVPVTSKHVLEAITPRVTRKPDITVTNTETPNYDKTVNSAFSTPNSTPEQFFTPMNTIKTYSKTNLRRGIVKNLEEEFSTPLGKEIKKENLLEVPTRSGRKVEKEKDRALRRATSPGKLNETNTRTRRVRQPKLN